MANKVFAVAQHSTPTQLALNDTNPLPVGEDGVSGGANAPALDSTTTQPNTNTNQPGALQISSAPDGRQAQKYSVRIYRFLH